MRHARRSLLLLATLAALSACHRAEQAPAAPRPAVFEHPQPETSAGTEVYPGAVRARVENDLSFRVAGKIARRDVVAGSEVKPGDVLAVLDPQDSALNVAAAHTTVAAAQADLQLATSEYRRYKDLLAKGFVSQSFVDLRRNQAELARARLAEAQARLNLVENQAGYTVLKADEPGVITAVVAEAGQVVAAGQPVMKFAAHGGREVVINVPEGRYEALRAAPALHITLWALPGKTYAGTLREISPQADPATRTHEARITVADAGPEVQLGMSASVAAGEAATATAFRLPLSALGGSDAHPSVWVIDSNHVKRVAVTISRYTENAMVVEGALTPESRVVTAGVHTLVDGQVVTAVQREIHGGGA